jgi:hypothetical protein
MMQCQQKVALATVLFLLTVMPAVCLAFTGKVSYPDGSPAVGARVSLTALVTDKKAVPADRQSAIDRQSAVMGQQHQKPSSAQARGGAAPQKAAPSVPPVPVARVTAKTRMHIVCDANGRFSFPDETTLSHAMIQIKAPSGHDYATVTLPVKAFQGGEVAVVLPPKK